MVPPFSLCVCRFFLSGPPLVSGGSSFLPRTLISGRQTQAYCFVCFYCNRIGTKYTKEKIILPNSFLPYTCQIFSLKCNLAGLFPLCVTLPTSIPQMSPCRLISLKCNFAEIIAPKLPCQMHCFRLSVASFYVRLTYSGCGSCTKQDFQPRPCGRPATDTADAGLTIPLSGS